MPREELLSKGNQLQRYLYCTQYRGVDSRGGITRALINHAVIYSLKYLYLKQTNKHYATSINLCSEFQTVPLTWQNVSAGTAVLTVGTWFHAFRGEYLPMQHTVRSSNPGVDRLVTTLFQPVITAAPSTQTDTHISSDWSRFSHESFTKSEKSAPPTPLPPLFPWQNVDL